MCEGVKEGLWGRAKGGNMCVYVGWGKGGNMCVKG